MPLDSHSSDMRERERELQQMSPAGSKQETLWFLGSILTSRSWGHPMRGRRNAFSNVIENVGVTSH